MSIKFEVGKYYRTVNGMKVRVVAIDGVEPYPIVGIVDGNFNGNWTKDGGHAGHINVITSEWNDKPSPPWSEVPKWFGWFVAWPCGRQMYYSIQPLMCDGKSWIGWIGCDSMTIPVSHRIPVTCDWKDSLVERPAT